MLIRLIRPQWLYVWCHISYTHKCVAYWNLSTNRCEKTFCKILIDFNSFQCPAIFIWHHISNSCSMFVNYVIYIWFLMFNIYWDRTLSLFFVPTQNLHNPMNKCMKMTEAKKSVQKHDRINIGLKVNKIRRRYETKSLT